MRGYFAIGIEGVSKVMNLGNLIRTAHGFGAAFVFTVDADKRLGRVPPSDTSRTPDHTPYYAWKSIEEMQLPGGCKLVGVELTDDAVDLPSFGHPLRAAYVLGPERGSLSPQMLERCDHVIRIPTGFCINVATAGAIVMYDRVRTMGRFAERPLVGGAPREGLADHVHGGPITRTGATRRTLEG
ncbi:RNA methyltransferase [Breoghania sp. JC706]|uniref:RNA methyltransferase n=1 Tax=Breoghania sp. JC706 TaxID=3117732 RepID=UPI0030094FCF